MTQAACAAYPPDLWYSDVTEEQKLAKAVCFDCPVQMECLEYALHHNEKFGTWGGLLPIERRRLKAKDK